MTTQEKIQEREAMIHKAADMIHDEMLTLGNHISGADALWLATRLHEVWENRVEIRTFAPREIAQRYRQRYECDSTTDLTSLLPDQ